MLITQNVNTGWCSVESDKNRIRTRKLKRIEQPIQRYT